jgi:hypothetical protein
VTSSVKTSRGLLPSAARSATAAGLGFASQIFIDTDAAAIRLYLTITVAPAGGGIAPVIRGYDKIALQASGFVSGSGAVELTTGGDPVAQLGTYVYELALAPDPPFGNIREACSRTCPYQWDAIVKHFDLQSYTYSLSAEIVR